MDEEGSAGIYMSGTKMIHARRYNESTAEQKEAAHGSSSNDLQFVEYYVLNHLTLTNHYSRNITTPWPIIRLMFAELTES